MIDLSKIGRKNGDEGRNLLIINFVYFYFSFFPFFLATILPLLFLFFFPFFFFLFFFHLYYLQNHTIKRLCKMYICIFLQERRQNYSFLMEINSKRSSFLPYIPDYELVCGTQNFESLNRCLTRYVWNG